MSDTARSSERTTVLLGEYREVCASHAKITDFRAKLLALLPIASGAGIGVLILMGTKELSNSEAALVVGLGVFGAVVTFGLFLYEVRQVDVCEQLRNHAAWLEGELRIRAGQFGGRRDRQSLCEIYRPSVRRRRRNEFRTSEKQGRHADRSKRDRRQEENSADQARGRKSRAGTVHELLGKRFVGAAAAGYIVYHSVIAAWVVLVVVGLVALGT